MRKSLDGWRPAVRMASRDVRRHPARSALVVLLVGLPVMLSAVAATLISTQQESIAETLPAQLGRAEASLVAYGEPVQQNPDGTNLQYEGLGSRPDFAAVRQQASGLTGGTLLPVGRGYARVVIGDRGWEVDVLRTDLGSKLTRGMTVLESGRNPLEPDEVLVTRALADDGAERGSKIFVGGNEMTVVGVGTVGTVGSHQRARGVAVPEDSVLSPTLVDDLSMLLDRRDPVTWGEVQRLNREGFLVISRSVVLNPPPTSQVDEMVAYQDHVGEQLAAIVVTALIIEVVLLAGPAFAVSVRRQRHELATVAAAGGSARDLRRIVLAQGLVLGAGASIGAAVLSVPASWFAARLAGRVLEDGVGPFQVAWAAVAVAAMLGVVAALIAAWVPARQAARSDVIAALAGRAPEPRQSTGWPILGASLMALGFIGVLSQASELGIASLTILTVVGAVLVTPAVIGLVARAAGRMPLPLRLAVRDADRQRSRSAPAVAAIMASVSAVTALAIASSSDAAQREDEAAYSAPLGAVTLSATTATMPAVVAAAERASGARFTPLPVVGDEGRVRQVFAMVPDRGRPGSSSSYPVAVADAQTLREWGVTVTPAQQSILDGGGALVADTAMIVDGEATLDEYDETSGEPASTRLPASVANLSEGAVPHGEEPLVAGAVVSATTAERLGLPVSITSARADRMASDVDVRAVREAVIAADPAAGGVDVERIYRSTYAPVYAILAVLGALAIALGTFSATGLALSDSRRDLATLVAVGASPRTRRSMAGAQALVLSVLGASMGVVIGFVPGLAAARTLTRFGSSGTILDVPWSLLAILVIGVPALVAAVTALVSRGRLPLERGAV